MKKGEGMSDEILWGWLLLYGWLNTYVLNDLHQSDDNTMFYYY